MENLPQNDQPVELIVPHTGDDLAATKTLFVDYASWLNVNLCFQDFDREMDEFPDHYCALRLAKIAGRPAGAVALKRTDSQIVEMKRLYCRDQFQGKGLGRLLAEGIIEAARDMGFKKMRLDTLESLHAALALYEKLGFKQIPAYYENPLGQVLYLQLDLSSG